MRLADTRRTIQVEKLVALPAGRKDIWRYNWESFRQFRWTMVALGFFLVTVLFASFERNMFLDQFLGLSLLGSLLVDLHFNLLYAVKITAGTFCFIVRVWLSDYH